MREVTYVLSGAGDFAANSPLIFIGPVVIVALGLETMYLKRRVGRHNTARRTSGEVAGARAASQAFVDTLVAGTAIGVAALFVEPAPALGVFALVVFAASDFWIRFAVMRQRDKRDRSAQAVEP